MQDVLPDHREPKKPLVRAALALFQRARGRLPALLFLGFSCLAISVFYAEPDLRHQIESYFFDLETRLKPASARQSEPLIVTIDEASLKAFHQESELSGEQILAVVTKLAASKAEVIALLLPENVLDYDSPAGRQVIQMIAADSRLVLGVLGYNQRYPSLRRLPGALDGIKDRVFGMDMLRRRSNDVVRRLEYTSYVGLEERVMLPPAVARRLGAIAFNPGTAYYLNFEPDSTFQTVNSAELDAPGALAQLDGKVVVLGYTVPVAWPYTTYEQMNANSPLRSDSTTYLHGESLTVITANAIENLMHGRALAMVSLPLRLCYVLVISGLTFWFWRRGALFGCLWVTLGLWAVLACQGVLMAYFAVYLPFADALLFAGLTSMLGAWQALQVGLRRYADERSFAERNRDIARVRSEFLERFAEELSRINQRIAGNAEQLRIPADAAPLFGTARRHLRSATEEFADYMAGVVQVSRLSVADRHPKLQKFDLTKLVDCVVERFAVVLAEKAMALDLDLKVGDSVMVKSNENIVDKIIFNFVSNAIKYSPSHTTIKVRIETGPRQVRVHVIDAGPGIAEEHQDLIFEKFYRVRNDDTYRIKGTGLGLYLSRYFAGLIGARIELESKLGAGADFALVLPL